MFFFFYFYNIVEVIILTFKYKYRKQIIAFSIIALILVAVLSNYVIKSLNKPPKKEKTVILKKKTTSKKEELKYYKVDIKGQINEPGIYTMAEGDRVIDVIEKAGGLTQIADTTVINLSKKVTDEMVIIIYSVAEVQNYQRTKEKEEQTLKICTDNEKEIKNDACIEKKEESKKDNSVTGKININTATKEELMMIPGIGEAKAESIIKYRSDHGNFKKIEDIKEVNGIGDGVFAKIKESITI